MVAVGVVLLIGCADVANLMFSRMVGRQHEFALRVALGAGKWRLARQTITEGLVLSIAGGILGACLAFWALPFLLRLAPEDLPFVEQAGLNGRVAVFVCALTLTTPLLFCLAPLFNVMRAAIAQQLRNSGRTSSQGRQQRFIMSGTVVLQFGLAFVLLAAAGLFIRSFRSASRSDPGFRPEHLLSIRIELPGTVYNQQAKISEFANRLIAKLGALPGVSQTGAVSDLPMSSSSNRLLAAQGRQQTERIDTIFCFGSALPALGIHALRGRLLAPKDALAKDRPAVLSESLARRLWPHGDPIGHHVKFGESEKEPWMTVVGVVKDVKSQLSSSSPLFLLFTTPEDWDTWMNALVRTSQDPLSLASAVRRQIKELDPSLPISKFETLDQVLDQSLAAERFRTSLLSAFAASALLLAMVGIAGLLAYHAAQRRQEFGVRLALGADRRDLLRLVLLHTLRLSATGIALGLAASFVVTRALSNLLYETSRYDPATFLAVPAILALVALCASVLPAWRAIHTDPVRALRAE
jgi:putative ABC transport system permease protein